MDTLPNELLVAIASYLDLRDHLALALTSKRTHAALLGNCVDAALCYAKAGFHACVGNRQWRAARLILKRTPIDDVDIQEAIFYSLLPVFKMARGDSLEWRMLVRELAAHDAAVMKIGMVDPDLRALIVLWDTDYHVFVDALAALYGFGDLALELVDVNEPRRVLSVFHCALVAGLDDVSDALLSRMRTHCDAEILSGVLACAVVNGDTQLVASLLTEPSIDPSRAYDVACGRLHDNQITIMRLLLADPRVDPCARNNQAIVSASASGFADVVKLLLEDGRVHPSVRGNAPLLSASLRGHVAIVRLLLAHDRFVVCLRDHDILFCAAENGHADVVDILLQDGRFQPQVGCSEVVHVAAAMGHTVIVRLLLEDGRADPCACDNVAVRAALAKGHEDIVRLLLADPRVDPAQCSRQVRDQCEKNGISLE